MYLHLPSKKPYEPLLFLTDYRLPSDADADSHFSEISRGLRADHVLEFYKPGRLALTPSVYHRCPRIALFDPGYEPTKDTRKKTKHLLEDALRRLNPKVIAIIPNEVGGTESYGATFCWQVFGAPDSCANMRGTFYRWNDSHVVSLHAPSPWTKQLVHWQQQKFIRRAMDVARGAPVLTCESKIIHLGSEMRAALQLLAMRNRPLAVDIESIESTGAVTAIGISDGEVAISMPWARFRPTGWDKPEKGIDDYAGGAGYANSLRELLRRAPCLYFHNFTFDVPRLKQEGFYFEGDIHDTMAAHAIAFPELRHGLQAACADLLPIAPWKSIWHPKAKGLTRDDEEYWTCDPHALRDYNADDAFHTYHLARQIMPCVQEAV